MDDNCSSEDDSFDEGGGGPTTYQEWKAFVVKTYLNGKDPQQKYQSSSSSSSPIIINTNHHHHQPQPFRTNKPDFKAKVAIGKPIQSPQISRPTPPSNPSNRSRAEDMRRFKIPDRDASGNPVPMQTTSNNPYATNNKPTSITNATIHTNSNINTSMTNSNNFATVTSSLSKTSRVQMSSSMPHPLSSVPTRITKSSNYPENNVNPAAKTVPSAQLKTRSDVFWSLNSAAKLLHVKAQLDEPSKIYVDKLVKNNGIAQREILKLKKEKQDLVNTIKMVEKVISDPQVTHN